MITESVLELVFELESASESANIKIELEVDFESSDDISKIIIENTVLEVSSSPVLEPLIINSFTRSHTIAPDNDPLQIIDKNIVVLHTKMLISYALI